MIDDIKELRIRLGVHFELIAHADKGCTDPLGSALLAAIDLVELIEAAELQTVEEVLQAWRNRGDEDAEPAPAPTRFPRRGH
jgi:hypothetical protein